MGALRPVHLNILRREFFGLCTAGLALGQQRNPQDEVIATATQDTTPRVGVVLSSFTGGTEHDGTKLVGLASPQPKDADLSNDFIEAWVRKAIEMGSPRASDLSKIVGPDDWVVIKTNISTCHGLEPSVKDGGAHQPYIAGSVTDLRIVRAVINYLVENKCGGRITIAEGSPQWLPVDKSKSPVDGWTTEWGGAFGGLSYRKMVEEFSKKHRGVRFEIADLNFSESLELPVSGKAVARQNPSGAYTIGKVIQQCDKLISIAPLKTDARTGVALTFSNYLGIAPGAKYGFPKSALLKLGSPEEVMVDLFSYHPADYCILGGPFGVEGNGPDGPGEASVRHNLLVTGTKAVSVDAVAALLMGFKPEDVPYFALAEKSGDYGTPGTDYIWTRGNDVEEASRAFRKAAAL
jgi:hypothetical protein